MDEESILFENRRSAGEQLAEKLEINPEDENILLALPRGGVIVAKPIADSLNLPINLIVSRKIGHPENPEYAIGAITEEGELIGNQLELRQVDQAWLQEEIARQKDEAARRRLTYLQDKKLPDLKNKTIIIVDDGVATGFTLLAAIYQVKKQKPAKIIVAIPVVPPEIAKVIEKQVDELVALTIPHYFLGAISGYYNDFPPVEDDEVIAILSS